MTKLLKQVFSALTLAGAMMFVTLITLGGVAYLAGILTDEKIADIAKVIDGELASPEEVEGEAKESVTEDEIEDEQDLLAAVARWDQERQRQQAALDAEREAAASVRRELEIVRAELDAMQDALGKKVKAFDTAKAAHEAALKDAGFQQAVKNFSLMKDKDVAAILSDLDDDIVVRYLKAFRSDKTAAVLTEIMKLDEKNRPSRTGLGDMNRAARLQEMIRGGEADAAAAATVAAN